MIELRATGGQLQIIADNKGVGAARVLDQAVVSTLVEFATTYDALVTKRPGDYRERLLSLGSMLSTWLDGDDSALSRSIGETTERHIEIATPLSPNDAEWAVLRAPWELLALSGDFLAAHDTLRVSIARRLGAKSGADIDLGDHRLGLTFMASAPRGAATLDFEQEEASILAAVETRAVDLIVEESGNLEELVALLSRSEPMTAVHISCHGINEWRKSPAATPVPALLTENEYGEPEFQTSGDLARALAKRCKFAFISACLTDTPAGGADQDLLSHSMTSALVQSGVPAVLGWAGSVKDRSATGFAARLYAGLATRVDIATAVADARRPMIRSEDDLEQDDWHMARLWLGPQGGGPIVAGVRKRLLASPNAAAKAFLGRRDHDVPVAGHEMFVGRRRALQTTLRELASGAKAGVLIQGMGRLGKSSLAARVSARMPNHSLVVVHGAYDAISIVGALEVGLADTPVARDLLDARQGEVRTDESRLYALLVDLISGPCAQFDPSSGSKPLLLVIDDLEQILETSSNLETARVKAGYANVLTKVIEAFSHVTSESGLLFTSRFKFALNGLEKELHHLPLGTFTESAQRKLAYRQHLAGAAKVPDTAERDALMGRVLEVTCGNPGLQDLIGLRLLYSDEVEVADVTVLLDQMAAWLAGDDLPENDEIHAFLEGLAVDGLVGYARADSQYLLRALTAFDLPIPLPVLEIAAQILGGSLEQLIGLGILDVHEDVFDPKTWAANTNRLVAGRISEPPDDVVRALAQATLEPLFSAWGGEEAALKRSSPLDVQLTKLACMAWVSDGA